jgi:CO/xanthine dehydrogenase Mo-binding subunit
VLGDTALTPDSGSAAASRTTTILHRGLREAAQRWPALVREASARAPGTPGPVLRIDLPAEVTPSAIPGAHWVFGASSALARVAVDRCTGRVRVEDLVIAAALGPVVSPMALLGQIEGGALMGVGLATTESLDCVDGRYAARNLDGYLVPTFADAPRIEVIAVQKLMPGDPAGPRGAGEIAVCIAAAAVANAIAAATGRDVERLPMRPAALIEPLKR